MHFVVKSDRDSRKLCRHMKKGNWMVLYKANWCGHCKHLQPHWNSFVKLMRRHPNLNLADVESRFIPAMKHHIEGYPTIKMFHNNTPVADFNDTRDVMGLRRFALSKIQKPVKKVTIVVKLNKNKSMKKPSVKKPSVKKQSVKKPSVKKQSVKKPSGKKQSVKKPTVKKPSVKKPTVKKPSVKKPAVKKPTTRKRSSKKTSVKKNNTKKRKRQSSNNLVNRMKKKRMKTQKPTSSLEILRNLKKSMSNIQKQSIQDKKLIKTLESIKAL